MPKDVERAGGGNGKPARGKLQAVEHPHGLEDAAGRGAAIRDINGGDIARTQGRAQVGVGCAPGLENPDVDINRPHGLALAGVKKVGVGHDKQVHLGGRNDGAKTVEAPAGG